MVAHYNSEVIGKYLGVMPTSRDTSLVSSTTCTCICTHLFTFVHICTHMYVLLLYVYFIKKNIMYYECTLLLLVVPGCSVSVRVYIGYRPVKLSITGRKNSSQQSIHPL